MRPGTARIVWMYGGVDTSLGFRSRRLRGRAHTLCCRDCAPERTPTEPDPLLHVIS
jgi:hypothetical protein